MPSAPSGGLRALQVVVGEADSPPSPHRSFLDLLPDPNLHFNLTLPGDPRAPRPGCGQRAHSVSLSLLHPKVGTAPAQGQEGRVPWPAVAAQRRPGRGSGQHNVP